MQTRLLFQNKLFLERRATKKVSRHQHNYPGIINDSRKNFLKQQSSPTIERFFSTLNSQQHLQVPTRKVTKKLLKKPLPPAEALNSADDKNAQPTPEAEERAKELKLKNSHVKRVLVDTEDYKGETYKGKPNGYGTKFYKNREDKIESVTTLWPLSNTQYASLAVNGT